MADLGPTVEFRYVETTNPENGQGEHFEFQVRRRSLVVDLLGALSLSAWEDWEPMTKNHVLVPRA